MVNAKKYRVLPVVIILLGFAAIFSSCSNSSYPCPGTGQSSAADLSLFDEDGKPKSDKDKKKKGNGLVTKKSPKKIRRRTNLKLE